MHAPCTLVSVPDDDDVVPFHPLCPLRILAALSTMPGEISSGSVADAWRHGQGRSSNHAEQTS